MIPSPHDIEISNEESTKIDTLSQNFYQKNHGRVPVLRLERLRLGSNCISSVNGRVDLKILKKASPGLFPKRKYTKRADGSKKGEIDSSDSGHHEKVKKKQEKKQEERKKKPEKKKIHSEIKVKINSASSSDDSDSDLEELRKKIMKPSSFKDKTSNQPAPGMSGQMKL